MMSDKWKHDNWHNNENNKHKCGIAEIDNCPYCRIVDLEWFLQMERTFNQDQVESYELCIDKFIAKLDAVKQIEDDCRERGFTETCWETIKRIREAIGERDE